MAIRFYFTPLVPCIRNGEAIPNSRCPKYFAGSGVEWSLMDYGLIPICLIAADVTTAQHNSVSAQPDVVSIPQNLDSQIGANLATVRSRIEQLRIPGNWAQATDTYRTLLRMIGGLFQFAQRHHGLHNQIIVPDNINLNQTWGDLPLAWRQNLAATAASFDYDTSGVTASTPIRTILKALADAWGSTPLLIGNTEI